MAESLFPELYQNCHAFMRHKDILLSPSLLRTYGIEYMQVGHVGGPCSSAPPPPRGSGLMRPMYGAVVWCWNGLHACCM